MNATPPILENAESDSPNSAELAVPPWILIHDDGSSIAFLNAFVNPNAPFAVADRESCLEAFEFLATGSPDPERAAKAQSTVDQFRDVGVLVPYSALHSALHADYGNQLPFGHFDFEVDARIDESLFDDRVREWILRLAELERRPQSIGVHFCNADDLPSADRWTKVSSLATSFTRRLSKDWGGESLPKIEVDFHVTVALGSIDESGLIFAENFANSIVRTRLESSALRAAEVPPDWLDRSAEIAALGFDVEVELATDGEAGIPSLCRSLIQRGHCTALLIKPTFPRSERRHDSWVTENVGLMNSLLGELGAVVHRSEPWKSIFRAALVPLHHSLHWNSKQAVIHLSASGHWSRSRFHFASARNSDLSDLLLLPNSTVLGNAWRNNRIDLTRSFDGAPDCESCEVLALCQRYWTPEFDAALRGGELGRAATIAKYECEMRKNALRILVLNLMRTNATFDLARANQALCADFDPTTKQVRIRSRTGET